MKMKQIISRAFLTVLFLFPSFTNAADEGGDSLFEGVLEEVRLEIWDGIMGDLGLPRWTDAVAMEAIHAYWQRHGGPPKDGRVAIPEGDWVPDLSDPDWVLLPIGHFVDWAYKENSADIALMIDKAIGCWTEAEWIRAGGGLADESDFWDWEECQEAARANELLINRLIYASNRELLSELFQYSSRGWDDLSNRTDSPTLGGLAAAGASLNESMAGMASPRHLAAGLARFGRNIDTIYNEDGFVDAGSYALTSWNVGEVWSGASNIDLMTGEPVGNWYQRGARIGGGVAATAGVAAGGWSALTRYGVIPPTPPPVIGPPVIGTARAGGAANTPVNTLAEVGLKQRIRAVGRSSLREVGEFFGWKPRRVSKTPESFSQEALLERGWTREELLDVARAY